MGDNPKEVQEVIEFGERLGYALVQVRCHLATDMDFKMYKVIQKNNVSNFLVSELCYECGICTKESTVNITPELIRLMDKVTGDDWRVSDDE